MVVGPEIDYNVAKYNAASIRKNIAAVTKDHKQSLCIKKSFFEKSKHFTALFIHLEIIF